VTRTTPARPGTGVPGEPTPGQLVASRSTLAVSGTPFGGERLSVLTFDRLPQRGQHNPRRRERQREAPIVDERRGALDGSTRQLAGHHRLARARQARPRRPGRSPRVPLCDQRPGEFSVPLSASPCSRIERRARPLARLRARRPATLARGRRRARVRARPWATDLAAACDQHPAPPEHRAPGGGTMRSRRGIGRVNQAMGKGSGKEEGKTATQRGDQSAPCRRPSPRRRT